METPKKLSDLPFISTHQIRPDQLIETEAHRWIKDIFDYDGIISIDFLFREAGFDVYKCSAIGMPYAQVYIVGCAK